jgi:hypothetical protein
VHTDLYDRDIFNIVWGPAVAAVKYIFDTAQNENVVQKAIGGFKQCAWLAAHFGLSDVFDKMVITLSNFTGLMAEVCMPFMMFVSCRRLGKIRHPPVTANVALDQWRKVQMMFEAAFVFASRL